MTDDELAQRVEASLEKDQSQLEEDLPDLLDDMEGRTDTFVREHPGTMTKVLGRTDDIDTASFASGNPETADQFQELLWSGVEVVSEANDEVQEQITEDISVNFHAEDSPMEGHLDVDEETRTVTGGAGTLEDPDLTITGPSDVLVGLVTGSVDPIQGFMQQQYEMDGPVQKGTQLAPIMNTLSDQAAAAE